MRYGMVIDLKKCIGCYGCQTACKAENATSPGVFWSRVMKQEFGKYPNVRRINLPLLCMHCEKHPCVDVCPTGASTRRREDGIVKVDESKCMGCKACMTACPYGARYYYDGAKAYFPNQGVTSFEQLGREKHPIVGVVQKCDFCLSTGRLQEGRDPACVEVCMVRARYFGNLDDPNSEVSCLITQRRGFPLNPELGTAPSVYYLPDY